jgi:hypothetical protein
MVKLNKKAAEESNVIIFIILALIVVGLVIWFSYGFFSTGTRLIDGNDPSVELALQSCKYEIERNPSALCNASRSVKIRGGGEMIVSCFYINKNIRPGALDEVIEKLTDPQKTCSDSGFIKSQCGLIKMSGVEGKAYEDSLVNGVKCKTVILDE